MGCCSTKNDVTYDKDVSKYISFHEGPTPDPTNGCDQRYHSIRGDFATFAVGPFREGQARFALLPGVIRTRVGYCGGKTILEKDFKKIKDHTEVVDIEYDPFVITYEALLQFFWKTHDATTIRQGSGLFEVGPPDRRLFSVTSRKDNNEGKQQHFSKIFYHSTEQKHAAEAALMIADRAIHSQTQFTTAHIRTDIEPAKYIFLANKEDQQYFLQEDSNLFNMVKCFTSEELMYSHLASYLNGLCSKFATVEDIEEAEKDFDLGLSTEAIAYLKRKISKNK